jgi:DNA-directed RNA polymerase subunit RPC12/RpoP
VLEREPQRQCMGCSPKRFVKPRLAAVPAPRDTQGLPDVASWLDRRDAWTDREMRRIAAVHGALTLDEAAMCMGLSRERIRQIQVEALAKLGAAMRAEGWNEAQAHEWLAGVRGEPAGPNHIIDGSNAGRRTDVHGYLYEERVDTAAATSDCEPGEPMAAACLAELERLERRVNAVAAVLDAARPSAELEAAE